MKNSILFFILTLVICFPVLGQKSDSKKEKPNLTGKWLLQTSEKQSSQQNLAKESKTKLEIIHKDPELHIKRTIFDSADKQKIKEFIYFTDGRGESNISDIIIYDERTSQPKETESKSRTKWNENTIYSRSISTKNSGGGSLTTEVIEKWELSKDGMELVHKIEVNSRNAATQILTPSNSSVRGIAVAAKPKIIIQIFRRSSD